MIMTLRKLLPVLCAGLLLIHPGFAQSSGNRHDGPKIPPIELSEITLAFATYNNEGKLVWETPTPQEPNTVPAGAARLRFTAKVNNRPSGSFIRIRAVLQELCPSPDGGKNYLAKLRHLTESDPASLSAESTDDESQQIGKDGRVTIEIPVHCDDCVPAICATPCPDRDHLGEGPHLVTLTTSDASQMAAAQRQAGAKQSVAAAKPSSFRLDIKSVCPKAGKKTTFN
jgi:hypothetical protein